MTLVSDIIRDAYRESNLISIGTEPSGAQRQEAIRFINRLVPSVLGYEGGENLETEYLEDASVFLSNTRLVIGDETPTTITLPGTLEDGTRFAIIDPLGSLTASPLTLSGGRNTIEGQRTVTLSTASEGREYFYRADLGNWQKVSPLVETDAWPFPLEFDDMFIITLALRLNPRYNITSQQESLIILDRSKRQFRSRYKQSKEIESELGLLNLLNAPNYSYSGFSKGSI